MCNGGVLQARLGEMRLSRLRPNAIQKVWLSTEPLLPEERDAVSPRGGELTPPYTPRRYLEAIEEFLAYGVDILVVDSFSHCWEGPGGVLEMADRAEEHGKKGLMKWLGPKRDYKKLVSFLPPTPARPIPS